MGERQVLQDLGSLSITLDWEDWIPWNRAVGRIVPAEPGVYEARLNGQGKRLHIGESTRSLKNRVRNLRTGTSSAGERIRASEELSKIELRWAVTGCYDAKLAEAWLQRLHRDDFNGSMPTYDKDPCHKE